MRVELFDDKVGAVEYISHMGTDLSVVNAARVSFGSEKEEVDEKDIKLINYLMAHNHSSPFEHCTVTFRFTVPLFIRSQHHRHRTWSYNEISRRYTDKDVQFYLPKHFRTQHESNRQASNEEQLIDPVLAPRIADTYINASDCLKLHRDYSLDLFNHMLDKGICREQARMVLPQNLYTEYYGTVNLSNLLKFIDLRTHEGAQWEIQKVAEACLDIATDLWPETVKSYRDLRH